MTLVYFFERAIKFVSENGIITFITSNGWLNNEYGHKFQKFLMSKTSVIALVDTNYKYFDNANVNTVKKGVFFFLAVPEQGTADSVVSDARRGSKKKQG